MKIECGSTKIEGLFSFKIQLILCLTYNRECLCSRTFRFEAKDSLIQQ